MPVNYDMLRLQQAIYRINIAADKIKAHTANNFGVNPNEPTSSQVTDVENFCNQLQALVQGLGV